MLTEAQLNSMRATLARSFPTPISVVRQTPVADGAGGFKAGAAGTTATYGRLASYIYGGMEVSGPGNRVDSNEAWTLTVPVGTDIRAKDRVVWAGGTLEVTTLDHSRTWNLDVRVMCKKVGG